MTTIFRHYLISSLILPLTTLRHTISARADSKSVQSLAVRRYGIILSLLLLSTPPMGSSQGLPWESVPGPISSDIYFVVPGGQGFLVAATRWLVFRSSDNGVSWDRTPAPWGASTPLDGITVDNENAIIAIAHSGSSTLYRLPSSESTWQQQAIQFFLSAGPLSVAGGDLFAGTPSEVVRSTDHGASWTSAGQLGLVESIISDPGGALLACTGTQIFRSIDSGDTWEPLLTWGNRVTALAVDPAGTLYAGDERSSILRSTNGGTNWFLVGNLLALPTQSEVRSIAAVGDSVVFASVGSATSPGLFKSTDRGIHWTAITSTLFDVAEMIATNGSGSVLLATNNGLGISISGGPWTMKGPAALKLASLAVGPHDSLFALGPFDAGHSRLYRTADHGSSWTASPGPPLDSRHFLVSGSRVLFASSSSLGSGGMIYRSTDNGSTWTLLPGSADSIGHLLGVAPWGSIYASGTSGLYRSTDYGDTWTYATISAPSEEFVSAVAFRPGGIVYAGFHQGVRTPPTGIYVSADSGATWTRIYSSPPLLDLSHLLAGPTGRLLAVYGQTTVSSTDNGQTWTSAVLPQTFVCFEMLPDGVVLAGGPTGISRSTDNGLTWQDEKTGPDSLTSVLSFALDSEAGWMYAGSDAAGLYRTRTTPVSVGGHFQFISPDFRLEQNYPNPFNPSTTIRFSLTHRANVKLTIYNLLGEKVAELVRGEIDAGNHEVHFNASNLASGVYYCRILAGTLTQVRSMVLSR